MRANNIFGCAKAGTFEAVLAQRDDSFELDALKTGRPAFFGRRHTVSVVTLT